MRYNSVHIKQVSIAVKADELLQGCLNPTQIPKFQVLSGIATPKIKRLIAARVEKKIV